MSLCKLHNAGDQVAEPVCQIGIIGVFEVLASYVSVLKWRDVPSQKVAHRVGAVLLQEFLRVDDVPQRLTHLASTGEYHGMHQNAFGQWLPRRKKHRGPHSRMKT